MKLVFWSAIVLSVLVVVGAYVNPYRQQSKSGQHKGHGLRHHHNRGRARHREEWHQESGKPGRNGRHHRGRGWGRDDREHDRAGGHRHRSRGWLDLVKPWLQGEKQVWPGLDINWDLSKYVESTKSKIEDWKNKFEDWKTRWTDMVPEWAAPWMRGRVQWGKGSPSINIDWDITRFFGRGQQQWWKGSNVCINRKTEEDKSKDSSQISRHRVMTTSQCDETDTAYRCTTIVDIHGKKKTFTVIYECCHGFQREKGKSGCTKELDLKDVIATMQDVGAKEMAKSLDSLQLTKRLLESNYTIFAPSDEAMKKFMPKVPKVNKNVIIIDTDNNMVTKMKELLTAHAVPGIVKTSNMQDEQLLTTANPNAKLRINIYERPKKMLTVNCGKVVTSDQVAKQGVIHVVDKILTPLENSLIDLVSKDRSLTTFKTMLGKSGLAKMLREDGSLTLFAPTDAAFSKLKPSMKEKLLRGQACLTNVLKNHILPNVICSSIIEGKVKTKNALDQYINMSRSSDNKLFVGNAQVISQDSMATNGVLHIIDNVLIPSEALDPLDTAEKVGASKFIQLISAAKLNKTLQTLSNFTLFIPTDAAIENMPEEEREKLIKNPEALTKVLKYHVMPGTQKQCRFLKNDQQFNTLDSNKKILVKEYSSFPFGLKWQKTVQCAAITRSDLKSCAGMIHLVDKVLMPPKGDLLVTLSLAGNFSRLIGLLKKSGVADQLTGKGPFTIFAPTDQALEALDADTLSELAQDKTKLSKVLQHHIMQDVLCCSGIFRSKWLWKVHERTLDGNSVSLNRDKDLVLVDDVPISQCDLTATDGVVHAIDKVLPKAIKKHTESHEKRARWETLPESKHRRRSHPDSWETHSSEWDELYHDGWEWDDDFRDRK